MLIRALSCILVTASIAPTCGQLIVAHRGASFDAPENTLAAFRLAWKQQADAIEGDFYLTKDEQIVCFHDKTTARTAPHQPELTVSKSTLAELQTLDVGQWKAKKYSGEKIPTLDQVLATVPDGKRIFVEIKCGPEIVPVLKPLLAKSGLKDEQIAIICFNQAVVSEIRRQMPQYRCNWLTGYEQDESSKAWEPGIETVLARLKATNATGLGTQGNLTVIDQQFADAVKQQGYELHVWTVNEPTDAKRFAALGFQSITTDKPGSIREALASP